MLVLLKLAASDASEVAVERVVLIFASSDDNLLSASANEPGFSIASSIWVIVFVTLLAVIINTCS